MMVPLTPDEDAVLFEYHRRDIQPDKLDKKTIKEIAKACNMSFERAGAAMLGLLEKDIFYVEEKKEREKKK
jgi:predicted transcriptional regulator